MAIPSSGHKSIPTVLTVSNSAPSWPGSPAAAIQLAESRIFEILSIAAAAILVTASAIAIRPEAGAFSTARGVRSPIAIASPVSLAKPLNVTAASATGTCHGPTIWSRVTSPPTVLSPIVIRKDLLPTHGKRSTRCSDSRTSSIEISRSSPLKTRRCTSRNMRGGLPNSTSNGISTGSCPNSSSVSLSCRTSVAWPSTANGHRSRRHMASKAASPPGSMAST